MPGVRLVDRAWPDVPTDAIVLVPVGSLEQHGPHLPLDTDSTIATAVAEASARMLLADGVDVLVSPTVTIGASGEHQAFPGTVSIGHDALRMVLVETVRSLATWSRRVVFVNGHGGNVPTLRAALVQMRQEGHDVAWVPCAFESATDAHAGVDETSVMLHLDPSRVDMSRAEPGRTEPLDELLPDLMAHGVRPVSPNGILGDPTNAVCERGATLVDTLVHHVARALRIGAVGADARLSSTAGSGTLTGSSHGG